MASAGKVRFVTREYSPDQQLEQIGQYLRTPTTDWDALWLRLAFSPVGHEFTRHKFVRTPIKALNRVLDWCAIHEQHAANRDSITQAQMAHLLLNVAHGFSGSKKGAPKTLVKDFLPYPECKGSEKESDGPDESTRFVLSETARKGQIPAYVLAALMKRASSSG